MLREQFGCLANENSSLWGRRFGLRFFFFLKIKKTKDQITKPLDKNQFPICPNKGFHRNY